MDQVIKTGLAWATLGLVVLGSAARGQQVIERDSKVTGPRGRTIERDVRVQRGPGFIDRQIEIKRPGGTLYRDTRIMTPGGPPGFRPGGYAGPRFVERNVFVRPPLVSTFVAAPFFSLFVGSPPPPPPPPPVLVYPEPVFVSPPMVVAPPPPPVVLAPPEPPPVGPADPLADPLGRLKSFHANSRRDGALTLGRIGDDRAVPALVDRLEHDHEKDVRVAAAWALGEIGDPRSSLPIERAALYDKKHEVRDAANIAYRKLPKPAPTEDPAATSLSPQMTTRPAPGVIRSRPEPIDPGPPPATAPPVLDDKPPPPPVPATGPALDSPRDLR